jgi:hypothetical protein
MNIALAKTETRGAVENLFTAARDRLPGTGRILKPLSAPACRIAGWKIGNTPTCAR